LAIELSALKAQQAAIVAETPAPEAEKITVIKQGFSGPVAVTVSFAEDGSILTLEIGDEDFNETPGLGTRVQDEEFIQSLIGKVAPLALLKADEEEAPNLVDAVTGATVTSQAVVEAINEAFEQFKK